MKEFFKHDHNSRNDPKLVILQARHGFAGIGLYWSIIEMMHEQCGCINRALLDEMLGIMHRTYKHHQDQCEPSVMLQTMLDLDLFTESDSNEVISHRVERNLLEYKNDSERGRKAAKVRWNAQKMQVHKPSIAKPMPEEEEEDKEEDEEERREEGKAPRSLAVAFKPPTIEDVLTMFRIRGLPDSEAELFHSYYDSQGWVKANGQPVRNWQQLIPSWATKYHKDKHNEQKHKRANGDRTHEPLTAEGLTEYRERTRAALNAAVETFQRDRTNEVDGRTNGEAPSVPALRIRRGDKWVDPNAIDP